MRINRKKRKFSVGLKKQITINHKANIFLKDDEMITFVTKKKSQYDITKKNWGYYISQSINKRVKDEGFKIAMVTNIFGRKYLMAVEKSNTNLFKKYCSEEKFKVKWLS